MAVGFGIIAPTIPLFAKSFGVNNAQVGSIISAFAFARFASGLFAGKLVDIFGERIVYTTGIAFVAISSFAAAMAQSFEQLLIYRAAGGLGSSMFSVAAGSIVLRAVDASQRARAQSLYNGSFLVGMMAGPVIGGLLTAISLRAPLLVYSALLVVASVAGGFLLRNSALAARPTEKSAHQKSSLRSTLSSRPLLNRAYHFIFYRICSLRYEPLDLAALYGRRYEINCWLSGLWLYYRIRNPRSVPAKSWQDL